jgi:TrmH family RNA methyltransferase
MITSASNSKVKLVRALAGRARDRREQRAFLAEGVRLVEDAVTSDWPFRFILHTAELSARGEELLRRLKQRGIEVDEVSTRLLASISETENSQGILAVLEDRVPHREHALDFVLIADSIRDPGNLGTLLRSAEAAGADAAFLGPGTTDAFAPKVVRSAMGAHFRLPLYEVNWDEVRTQVGAYRWNVYLADMDGASCWETKFHRPLALIIGGEAEGATASARAIAVHKVGIPMQGRGESLNAAVAGSVLMFEVARQAR